MTKLSIRSVMTVRARLIDFLKDAGIQHGPVILRVHDAGLSLVVNTPTSEIPEEFHGVPIETGDSV